MLTLEGLPPPLLAGLVSSRRDDRHARELTWAGTGRQGSSSPKAPGVVCQLAVGLPGSSARFPPRLLTACSLPMWPVAWCPPPLGTCDSIRWCRLPICWPHHTRRTVKPAFPAWPSPGLCPFPAVSEEAYRGLLWFLSATPNYLSSPSPSPGASPKGQIRESKAWGHLIGLDIT